MIRTATLLIAGLTTALASDSRPLRVLPASGNSVELFVDKTGALSGKRHRFLFERFEGSVLEAQSRVSFRLDANSIVCKDTWVSSGDLKKIEKTAKVDMLAADRHPWIEFVSATVDTAAPNRLRVSGMLTIRDKTKPVTVDVERDGNTFRGTATIRLTDFGLKPPSAAFGLVGTKNEMKLQFTLVAQE